MLKKILLMIVIVALVAVVLLQVGYAKRNELKFKEE